MYLTKGKIYDCFLTPTLFDPRTMKPLPDSYITNGNDGGCRKYDARCFMTIEEYREEKLNELIK